MKDALEEIFKNNYSALCNYAYAIVKDKHAAKDVVQTVFIQLWENDKINHLKNPEPFLLKCVKYKCLDHLKGLNRKKEIPTDSLPELSTEESYSLSEEDIEPMLLFFAHKLPPKMQQVFLMSRQQGLSYKEIAQELNISVKTVENQMGSALKKMRILLAKYNYLPFLTLLLKVI